MRAFLITSFLAAAVVLFQHGDGTVAAPQRDAIPAPVRVVDAIGAADSAGEAITIRQASIEGDLLTVDVTYPGGCRVHGFRLLVEPATADAAAPVAGALLAHNAYGDQCEAPVNQRLQFDLGPLARAEAARDPGAPSDLVIRLDGLRLSLARSPRTDS